MFFWYFKDIVACIINLVGVMISMVIKCSFKYREFFFNPNCSLTALDQECACSMVKSCYIVR